MLMRPTNATCSTSAFRESFEVFLASIRDLIKSCNFCTNCHESILRDKIVLGVSRTTRELLLRERQLSLKQAIDICKSTETASTTAKILQGETTSEPVNRVDRRTFRNPRRFSESSVPVL
jgi:hypothetical protein